MSTASWERKKERIQESHPQTLNVQWDQTLQNDSDLWSRIIRDVVKSYSGGSKPGKRPSLSASEAREKYAQLVNEDFSQLEFLDSFRILCGQRSMAAVANKCGLHKSYIHKLFTGKAEPSIETLEKIAAGFRKHPSFFLEYRIHKVNQKISSFLVSHPETATAWYLETRSK